MVTLVILINLFCVPVVSLWIHDKNYKIEPEASVRLLMQYAIFVACNVPLTKVGIALVRVILGWNISIDSGYYTLLAIVAAVLLPELLDKIQVYFADRTILLQDIKTIYEILLNKVKSLFQQSKIILTKRSIKYRQKLIVSLLLVALIVITYIIRKPLEIYVGNANEFLFVLSDFLPYLVLIALGIFVITGVLSVFLSDAIFTLVSVLLLWFGVASWMQDLFLNKKLSEVDGGPMDWDSLGSLPNNNLLIWLVLLFVAILLCIILKQKWFSFTKLLAGGLCLVQLVAIGTVFINMPEQKKPELVLSGDEQMYLASEENVIVFIMDSISPHVTSTVLHQYPEASSIIKDFVYYNNACCDYYRTFPSLTHILTGNEFDFGNELFEPYAEDWQKESWESERCKLFYQKLKDNGYSCRYYEDISNIRYTIGSTENLYGKFNNIQEAEMHTDTCLLLQKLLKLSAYCCLPYTVKPQFEVLTSEFSGVVSPEDMHMPISDNAEYYKRLTQERLSVNYDEKKLFVVNYLFGVHPPAQLTAEATFVEQSTGEETMRGLFTILEEYFDQLKSLGLYDSSTIIIMGDHGNTTPEGFSSDFFIKRAGDNRDLMEINSAPVDYNDFQATILELIGANDGSFGSSFFDWNAGDERRRIIYIWYADDKKPKVAGSSWNFYHGYVYYHDAEELCNHVRNGEPDIIERANKWRTAPW